MSALTDTFTSIANAIRTKLGVQTTYTPAQMSTAIASIPTQKPEQTKSVTATTSQQTVTPDTGKVLSSVTVNPQVHSATYTPTGYSNANDMGAQNNYRYVDTSAYEPTSITPSNSSPVAMAANTGYKPTASGYAISSYSSVTPSSSQVAVASGDVVKIGGSGVIVNSVPTPTNLAPSDSTPAAISSGGLYSATGNGYAIESQPTSITPSSYTPVDLTAGNIYKMNDTGKAVGTILYRTPSDTSAPSLMRRNVYMIPDTYTGYGYLYATQQPAKGITLLGSITIADTSSHTVTLSQSIKNFRYCMVVLEKGSFATDKVLNNNTGGGCASVVFFDTDKWVSGFSQTGGYTTGGAGSQYTRDDIISYNSNTKMNITHSQGTSRTDYIYGIN